MQSYKWKQFVSGTHTNAVFPFELESLFKQHNVSSNTSPVYQNALL